MEKRERGDIAITSLLNELDVINKLGGHIKDRVGKIDNAYRKAAGPWMLEGDDRVLDKMRIEASSALEKAVSSEVCSIKTNLECAPDAKVHAIREIERLLIGLPWVPEGFKSSLKVDIAFAISEVHLGVGSL